MILRGIKTMNLFPKYRIGLSNDGSALYQEKRDDGTGNSQKTWIKMDDPFEIDLLARLSEKASIQKDGFLYFNFKDQKKIDNLIKIFRNSKKEFDLSNRKTLILKAIQKS